MRKRQDRFLIKQSSFAAHLKREECVVLFHTLKPNLFEGKLKVIFFILWYHY